MSVKKFKFVSPGVFTKEIDNSQLPAAERSAAMFGEMVTTKGQLMPHTRLKLT